MLLPFLMVNKDFQKSERCGVRFRFISQLWRHKSFSRRRVTRRDELPDIPGRNEQVLVYRIVYSQPAGNRPTLSLAAARQA